MICSKRLILKSNTLNKMREKPGFEKPNTSKKSAEESARGLPASRLAPTAGYGTPGTTRTYDLRIRSPLLYPAELQARNFFTGHRRGPGKLAAPGRTLKRVLIYQKLFSLYLNPLEKVYPFLPQISRRLVTNLKQVSPYLNLQFVGCSKINS